MVKIKYNIIIIILKFIFLLLCICNNLFNVKKSLQVAICTMARKENLYIKEYVDYHLKIGFDHIFIFDDNEPGTENISDIINDSYNEYVTIYDYSTIIHDQKVAFTLCYEMNKYKYDWILMNDIDEFLVIRNDTLKNYLSNIRFKKCDFIKFHWMLSTDNDLIHYDNRSLLERFKGPYRKNTHIKTMVKGGIDDIQFDIHTPFISPHRNISCNNIGQIYKNKEILFQDVFDINVEKAFMIHFKYKSTEEYINKYKRGYHWRVGNIEFMLMRIREYFKDNKATLEKVEYVERELDLNLTEIKNQYNLTNN